MKKLIISSALVLCVLCFKQANAQLSISINIGSQPTWGPIGYNHVDYYYFPDIDCYYYVPGRKFIYLNGSTWVHSTALPARYSNFDLYNGYKVVLNGTPKPYLHAGTYRTKYASYKGRRGQSIIRDSHDSKYSRPGNNRPPARPQPKPQPSRPGNGNRPQPKPQPARPGNDNHSQPKPSNGNDRDKRGDHR